MVMVLRGVERRARFVARSRFIVFHEDKSDMVELNRNKTAGAVVIDLNATYVRYAIF